MQFSIYRVWLLCKKQWAENQQLYLLGLLAIAGIMSAAFLIPMIQAGGLDHGHQQAILLGGAAVTGGFFASTILSRYSDKTRGIQALILPASAAEKLAAAIIYALIIFPLAYLLVAYPVMVIFWLIDTRLIGHVSVLYNLNITGRVSETVGLYVMLQAVILLCSVLFKRYTIVKTIVLVMIVFYGLLVINPVIAGNMLDVKTLKGANINIRQVLYNDAGKVVKDTVTRQTIGEPVLQVAGPYSDIGMYFKDNFYKINLKLDEPHTLNMVVSVNNTGKLIFHILFLLSVAFLWLITWFRLKETQL